MRDQASWLAQLQDELARSGKAGAEAARYLRYHRIQLGIHEQPTAARWTVGRRIELHPRYARGPAAAPYALSLVLHELQHVRQGFLTALSVYGELEAWRLQFRFIKARSGPVPGTAEQKRLIGRLLSLPLRLDRFVLQKARDLMQAYAGPAYRIDLLPLYPIHHEVVYRIFRRSPSSPRRRFRQSAEKSF